MLLAHLLCFGFVICLRDYREHLISKRVTHLALITLVPLVDGSILQAAIMGFINFAIYAILKAISPQGIGSGDIRLSILIGFYISAFGGGEYELIWCNTVSWLACSITAIFHFVKRESLREKRVAFAPYLFFGLVCYAMSS